MNRARAATPITRRRLLASGVALVLIAGLPLAAQAASTVRVDDRSASSSGAPSPSGTPPRAGDPIPGRLIVRFKSTASKAQREGALQRAASRTSRNLRIVPGLQLVTTADGPGAVRRLRAEAVVEFVEQDRYVTIDAIPNDPEFGGQWGLHQDGDADIDAPEAWDITTGDPAVVVAVIDTGAQLTHPELASSLWLNLGEVADNGIDDDDNGFIDDVHGWDFWSDDADPSDEHGHGTHVAGIAVAQGDNALGMAGVAWSSRLMVLRMIGPDGFGSVGAGVAAIDYASRMGARVANLSWTGPPGTVQPLMDVIAEAGERGLLSVAAAGNASIDLDETGSSPATFEDPSLVTVGALTAADDLAEFSNVGRATVDLAAPGEGIISLNRFSGYAIMSGTSMAAPFVAGTAALVLAEHPTWDPAAVRARILDSVRPVLALAGTTATGGAVNAAAALIGPADEPPVISVTAPDPIASALPKDTVTFAATATDREDGDVSASIEWRSSLSGLLGSGPSVSRADLAIGMHRITATAADSAGHRPVRVLELTVGPSRTKIASAPMDRQVSIAVGPSGLPQIAFPRYGVGTYAATSNAQGSWSAKLVADSYDDRAVDLAIDADDQPSIAIAREWSSVEVYSDPGIMLASRAGASWSVGRISQSCADANLGCGRDQQPSVALGAGEREEVVFVRNSPNIPTGSPAPAGGIYHARRTANGGWDVDVIQHGIGFFLPSLAIGSDGSAHVVWMVRQGEQPGAWYATNANGSWVRTRLSSASTQSSPRVAVDAAGRVRVVLVSPAGVWLRTRHDGTWDAWTVVYSGAVTNVDLAIDPSTDHLHLAAGQHTAAGTVSGIIHVSDRSGTWETTQIEQGNASGPSIAVGPDGSVHIAYMGAGIRYATDRSGSWARKTVVAGYAHTSIGFDVDGRRVAHALLSRYGTAMGTYYGSDSTGTWSLERAAASPPDAGGAALAVNSIGEAHIVYGTYQAADSSVLPDPAVYYSTNASGSWKSIRLSGNGGTYRRDIALDRSGRVHAVFAGRDSTGHGLVYATNASGTWTMTRLKTGDYGDASIAVDAAGRAHIAVSVNYQSPEGGGWTLAYLTNASGSWQTKALTTAAIDIFPEITLDAEGEPNVAFLRAGVSIRLTELRGTTWVTRIVVGDPAAGPPSLTIDANGTRRVAYPIGSFDYAVCSVPLCPDYPGLRLASAGPTGPFAVARITDHGEDSAPVMVRGRDGSLALAALRGGVEAFEMRLEKPSARTATAATDGTATSVARNNVLALTATLKTAGGTPLVGRSIVFKVDGVSVGSAVTNASGVASRTWTASTTAGAHTLTIGFVGGGGYLATRIGPRALTVTP